MLHAGVVLPLLGEQCQAFLPAALDPLFAAPLVLGPAQLQVQVLPLASAVERREASTIDAGGTLFRVESESDSDGNTFRVDPESVDDDGIMFRAESESDGEGNRFRADPESDGDGTTF